VETAARLCYRTGRRRVGGCVTRSIRKSDWQWLVERGVEIISKASRHLPDDLKARNPEIRWQKVAGIGNVLRHNYESIAAPVPWKLVQADLPTLEKACRSELAAEEGRERRRYLDKVTTRPRHRSTSNRLHREMRSAATPGIFPTLGWLR
jgi:uncharacterized protein with HEPN domain